MQIAEEWREKKKDENKVAKQQWPAKVPGNDTYV